jgi:hypothetical protein
VKIGVVLVAGVLAAPVLSFTHSTRALTHSVIHPFPQSPTPPLQNGCAWSPPKTAHTITIKHAFDLVYLLPTVKKGTTVLLEDGDYVDSTRTSACRAPWSQQERQRRKGRDPWRRHDERQSRRRALGQRA